MFSTLLLLVRIQPIVYNIKSLSCGEEEVITQSAFRLLQHFPAFLILLYKQRLGQIR